jgi:three-Cys-motif partner protein
LTDLRDQLALFTMTPPQNAPAGFKPLRFPIWTENKARLIQKYLFYFVLVTKHGNYIDAFAGPQDPDYPDTWAAKLVLESKPRWLRKFFLYELERSKVRQLEELRDAQAPPDRKRREPKREVVIKQGDANVHVPKLLAERAIREKEATFCLLDQRSTECHWATVQALAAYKPAPKIELFYFFPVGWLARAMSGFKTEEPLEQWWGGDGWRTLQGKPQLDQACQFAARFRDELGYRTVAPWPIHASRQDKRIMYYMIHASDHEEAQKLMHRAYHLATTPEAAEQAILDIGNIRLDV